MGEKIYKIKAEELSNGVNNLPKEEILRNLRVLIDGGFTNAGVLYFAR